MIYIFSYLENKNSCFPVTIITTEKEITDKTLEAATICSISVQTEKMTFDSSVFNHYEKLPVKDIYLYSVEIPYSEWERLKSLEDAITEANPYLEDIVKNFSGSKMKYFSISFIFIFFIGLVFLVKTAPSWKSSIRQFKISVVSVLTAYFGLSGIIFSLFKKNLYPFISITLFILLIAYTVILLIIWRLMKNSRSK